MHAKVRKFTLALAAVAVAVSTGTLSGCSNKGEVERPPDPTLPAKRAAQAWVHCLEQSGGACVTNLTQFGSWDAYALLGWLATGTPTSILSGLRRELQHHRDPRSGMPHGHNADDRGGAPRGRVSRCGRPPV